MGFGQHWQGGTQPANSGSAEQAPTFKDYPVERPYKGKVALPEFQKRNPDRFPEQDLRCAGADENERALFFGRKKVNFAGRYVVDACTCGTGCHYLFMWDAESGKLFRQFPFGEVMVGPYLVEGKPEIEYSGEHYNVGSSLLIVEGCLYTAEHPGRRDCARFYYNWNGQDFVRVFRQHTRVPPS